MAHLFRALLACKQCLLCVLRLLSSFTIKFFAHHKVNLTCQMESFPNSVGLIQQIACKGEETFMEEHVKAGLRFLQYQLIRLVPAQGFP